MSGINKYKLKRPSNIIIPILDLSKIRRYTQSSSTSGITLSNTNSEFNYSYTTCSTGIPSNESNINTICICNICNIL
jgi:hypothetical protein